MTVFAVLESTSAFSENFPHIDGLFPVDKQRSACDCNCLGKKQTNKQTINQMKQTNKKTPKSSIRMSDTGLCWVF